MEGRHYFLKAKTTSSLLPVFLSQCLLIVLLLPAKKSEELQSLLEQKNVVLNSDLALSLEMESERQMICVEIPAALPSFEGLTLYLFLKPALGEHH